MRILIIDEKSFGTNYMVKGFKKRGYDVDVEQYTFDDISISKEFDMHFEKDIVEKKYDIIFTFNYFPAVSNNCEKYGIKYVSWVYSSPHVTLYSYTTINKCNYIFIFDKEMYLELKNGGIDTVYYMPLAADTDEYDKFIVSNEVLDKYKSEVSFVGSLYNEDHNLYDKFEALPPYIKGYLDGLVNVQSNMYGYFFLQEMLTDEMVQEIKKCVPYEPRKGRVDNAAYVYAHFFMARKSTEIERCNIIKNLSDKFNMKIYTKGDTKRYTKVINMGTVDYYKEMPYVFKCSKINLNISLKSIRSGIPLRAFDIMGSGGFLISNYQEDFMDYFVPGEDFEVYENIRDLEGKIQYYLAHDDIRQQIALNGYNKVKEYHNFDIRINQMMDVLKV